MASDPVHQKIADTIASNDVVLFMKGTKQFPQCGFSATAAKILEHLGVPFKDVNVLDDQGIRDGIKAFSATDFSEDLKSITVPTLILHGDDDQIVPVADSALLSAKLVKHGTLKVYERLPHGMCTTHADLINAELLSFIAA